MRGHLSRVDGDSCVLGTDTNSHDESGNEETFPGLGESGTDRGGGQTESSDKDLASSTQVVVEGIDDESTTADLVRDWGRRKDGPGCRVYSHETCGQEDDGIDDANNPLIAAGASNAELIVELQVGAVGTSLIPALGGGADGT